jgi:hypothetical protein
MNNVICVLAAAAAAEAAVAAGRGEGALVGQTPSNYVLLKVILSIVFKVHCVYVDIRLF